MTIGKWIRTAIENPAFMTQLIQEIDDTAITTKEVTYENLDANGDVGQIAGTVAAGADTRIPTQDENNALVGYLGGTYPPVTANPYVTINSITPLLGGNYKAGTYTRAFGAGSGQVAYTGLGFTPKSIVASGICTAGFFSIGWATATGAQYCLRINLTANTITMATDKLIEFADAGIGINLDSLDADGFTVTYAMTGADDLVWSYLVGN